MGSAGFTLTWKPSGRTPISSWDKKVNYFYLTTFANNNNKFVDADVPSAITLKMKQRLYARMATLETGLARERSESAKLKAKNEVLTGRLDNFQRETAVLLGIRDTNKEGTTMALGLASRVATLEAAAAATAASENNKQQKGLLGFAVLLEINSSILIPPKISHHH